MQPSHSNKSLKKCQVKIKFSPKLITSRGGTAALFSRFFDKIRFREAVLMTICLILHNLI
ncbi:MAG: hypothetical protein PWP64_987, partial [Candidatus Cloacimonadota bacterium]|nr:hypothetical protein [Candidatus Cloacimonadota bacterium]